MLINNNSQLGSITIEDSLFKNIFDNAIINVTSKVSYGSEGISVSEEESLLSVYVPLILEFGSSIKDTSDTILNFASQSLKSAFPNKKIHIDLHIVGIKSKQIAKRDLLITREV